MAADNLGVMSRRRVLQIAGVTPAAWVLAGCTISVPGSGDPAPGGAPLADDPDVVLLRQARTVVDELEVLVARAMQERRRTAEVLAPVLATHRRHAEVLGAADPEDTSPTPDPTSTPAPLPRGPRAVLSLLAAAEQRAAATHLRQVRRAESGQFAQLLAAVSAAEAQLTAVLEEAAR